jgi:hypothetical protein
MFGCFRKGEANDPELYVAAVAAVLGEYPRKVIDYVTDPRTGLPRKVDFHPTIAEISRACELEMTPIAHEQRRAARELEARQLTDKDQMDSEAKARVINGLRELADGLKNGTLKKMERRDDD